MAKQVGSPTQPLPATVWVVSASVVGLLLLVASRYGFHRDELYFVAAGRRLAWGYVDQPPLTPLLARLADLLPGAVSPFHLRVVPALSVAGLTLIAATLARRFGGGRFAVGFAAFAAAGSAFFLATGHLLATSTIDALVWAVVILLVARLIDGSDPRWWLAVGLVVGIGMLNKHLVAFLAIALLIGLLLTPQRTLLASPWPWAGTAVAAVIAAPNIVWQAANGWPQWEMAESLRARSDGPAAFALLQLVTLSIVLVVPAIAGLVRLWATRWRAIAIAFAVLFAGFLVIGGTFYYVAPLYVPLLASGACWLEDLGTVWRRLLTALAGVGVAVFIPLALPIAPPVDVGTINEVNAELGETIGWPQLIDQLVEVHESIPVADREGAVVLTSNYGEAGAIEVLAANRGLPPVMSGHNNYWLWGPVAGDGPIIGVGPVEGALRLVCADFSEVAIIDNGHGVDNEEQGYPILLCMEPERSLATVWDRVRHYN